MFLIKTSNDKGLWTKEYKISDIIADDHSFIALVFETKSKEGKIFKHTVPVSAVKDIMETDSVKDDE